MDLSKGTRSVAVACLAACLLAAPAVARAADAKTKPKIDGYWDAPAGRLQLATNGTKVAGRLVSANEGATVKVGEQLLFGSLDEDNLSADVRVGVVAPKCGNSEEKAFVVLLVTKSGKLTGGVSSKAACAAEVPSVTLVRSKEGGETLAASAKPPEAPSNDYGANGQRRTALDPAVKELMEDAKAYISEGQFEKARDQLQKALSKDSRVGEIYNGIGATFAARSDYGAAVDWYKKGLEAAPGFGDLYYNLACAYAQQDKKSLALRYLKLAATKGYAEVSALDEDHDLDPIRSEPEFTGIRKIMQGSPAGDASPTAPVP